jgi:hypothetical protein
MILGLVSVNLNDREIQQANEGMSAAIFCCQVAAFVSVIYCKFYLVKNDKIANNSATTEAREEISTYLESLWKDRAFALRTNV